ncbi:MAG: DNA-directed RNA polymerase subunit K [Candidatus Hodarchaeales archaeon]
MTKSKVKHKIEIGPKMLTRFEYARILGARALQISMGAPVLGDISASEKKEEGNEEEEGDPLLIAEDELKREVLPILILRTLPNGKTQIIPLSWLEKPWEGRKDARATLKN